MLNEDFETEAEGWQVDRVAREAHDRSLLPRRLLSEGVPDDAQNIVRLAPRWRGGRGTDFEGQAGRQHRFLGHSARAS